MAWEIPLRNTAKPPFSARVAYHFALVAAKLRDRSAPREKSFIAHRFRRGDFSVHALEVCHSAPGALLRNGQPEFVPRLKQHGSRGAQTLPYSTVGSLPEISALRVLDVRFSCDDGYAHVGYRRAGQNSDVHLFLKMGQYQALPVDVQRSAGSSSR